MAPPPQSPPPAAAPGAIDDAAGRRLGVGLFVQGSGAKQHVPQSGGSLRRSSASGTAGSLTHNSTSTLRTRPSLESQGPPSIGRTSNSSTGRASSPMKAASKQRPASSGSGSVITSVPVQGMGADIGTVPAAAAAAAAAGSSQPSQLSAPAGSAAAARGSTPNGVGISTSSAAATAGSRSDRAASGSRKPAAAAAAAPAAAAATKRRATTPTSQGQSSSGGRRSPAPAAAGRGAKPAASQPAAAAQPADARVGTPLHLEPAPVKPIPLEPILEMSCELEKTHSSRGGALQPAQEGAAAAVAAENAARAEGALQTENAMSVGQELDGRLFQLGRKLGSGSFATVYLARQLTAIPATTDITQTQQDAGPSVTASFSFPAPSTSFPAPSTGRRCVVKKLDRTPSDPDEVMNEIELMRRAGFHPNLVHFQGWYRDITDNTLCLVMGYCEGGTLAGVLKGKPGSTGWQDPSCHFPESVVMTWFVQLLMALSHIHARQIIHRDLKPENIFLTKNLKVIKLGDLGIAKKFEGSLELAITCLGTPYYMSPEVIAARPYTYASDMWSLGCVLYEMAARRPAFEAVGLPQLMFKIMRTAYEPLPPVFSRPFQQLVTCLLRADPGDRPTTQELLQMPFVRKHLQMLMGQTHTTHVSGSISISPVEALAAIRRLAGRSSATTRASTSAAGPPATAPATAAAPPTISRPTLHSKHTASSKRKSKDGFGDMQRVSSSLQSANTATTASVTSPSPAPPPLAPQASSRRQRTSPRAIASSASLSSSIDTPQGDATGATTALQPQVAQPPQPAQAQMSRRGSNRKTSRRSVARGGGDTGTDVVLVKHGKAVIKDWDHGAAYEAKLARQAEQRFKAREFEQRLTREQVRVWRKERDPEHQQREAEIQALQQRMWDERNKHRHRSHGVDVYGLENAEEGSLGVYGAPDTVQRGPVDPTLNLGQDTLVFFGAAVASMHGGDDGAGEEGLQDEYIDDEFNALGTAAAAALLGGISASLDTAQLLETTTGLHADMDTGDDMVLLGTEESTLITDTDLRTGTDTHLAMGQGADTMQPTDAVTKQYEVDNVTALHGDVTVCEDPAGGQVESSFDEVLYGSAPWSALPHLPSDTLTAHQPRQPPHTSTDHASAAQPHTQDATPQSYTQLSNSASTDRSYEDDSFCENESEGEAGIDGDGREYENTHEATHATEQEPMGYTRVTADAVTQAAEAVQPGVQGAAAKVRPLPPPAAARPATAPAGPSRPPRYAPRGLAAAPAAAGANVGQRVGQRHEGEGGSNERGVVLRTSLQDLQHHLTDVWDTADDAERRHVLRRVWRLTVEQLNLEDPSDHSDATDGSEATHDSADNSESSGSDSGSGCDGGDGDRCSEAARGYASGDSGRHSEPAAFDADHHANASGSDVRGVDAERRDRRIEPETVRGAEPGSEGVASHMQGEGVLGTRRPPRAVAFDCADAGPGGVDIDGVTSGPLASPYHHQHQHNATNRDSDRNDNPWAGSGGALRSSLSEGNILSTRSHRDHTHTEGSCDGAASDSDQGSDGYGPQPLPSRRAKSVSEVKALSHSQMHADADPGDHTGTHGYHLHLAPRPSLGERHAHAHAHGHVHLIQRVSSGDVGMQQGGVGGGRAGSSRFQGAYRLAARHSHGADTSVGSHGQHVGVAQVSASPLARETSSPQIPTLYAGIGLGERGGDGEGGVGAAGLGRGVRAGSATAAAATAGTALLSPLRPSSPTAAGGLRPSARRDSGNPLVTRAGSVGLVQPLSESHSVVAGHTHGPLQARQEDCPDTAACEHVSHTSEAPTADADDQAHVPSGALAHPEAAAGSVPVSDLERAVAEEVAAMKRWRAERAKEGAGTKRGA